MLIAEERSLRQTLEQYVRRQSRSLGEIRGTLEWQAWRVEGQHKHRRHRDPAGKVWGS